MVKYDYSNGDNFQITSKQLEEAFKILGLKFFQNLITAYADKEQRMLYAIECIEEANEIFDYNKPNHCITSKDPRFLDTINKSEVWIEYVTISCMGLTDIIASLLNLIFNLKMDKGIGIYPKM